MSDESSGTESWSLDPRLRQDTTQVEDLALSRMLLMNDAKYPWLILVPRRAEVVEIIDLNAADRAQLMNEVVLVSRALRDVTACDKLNVAALGNMVPQLHVHIIARRKDDAAWPRPVWGAVSARPYRAEELERFLDALRYRIAAN